MTPDQALAHPTWNMGPVITINSATLVNKGLELIEAHLLFGVPFDRIEVVVHRQSVIHSMVEFTDGSTIAQASPPDMRIPIALAMAWPQRVPQAAAQASVDGEFSFVQTLRHLAFAMDKWFTVPILGGEFDPMGLPNTGGLYLARLSGVRRSTRPRLRMAP